MREEEHAKKGVEGGTERQGGQRVESGARSIKASLMAADELTWGLDSLRIHCATFFQPIS